MNTATLAIGLVILAAAIASALAHAVRRKQRKSADDARRIAHAVTEYFTRSSAEVSAKCLPLQGRFLVLVESEPLKRFRYSHIVEASLIGHIEKTLGLRIDRIYWRFPLPLGTATAQDTADFRTGKPEDEYVAEGIREARTNPEYHVAEDSWEQFEMARQQEVSGSVGGISSPPAAPENEHAGEGECGAKAEGELRAERVP